MGLLSRKSVDTFQEEAYGGTGPRLKRSLGTVDLVAFGVGCTVGSGIFSLTGVVAAHTAGPAVSLSFVLASIACFFAGLCYAEFATMVPVSGSAYSYAYATLGELVAWLIGWSLITEWLFSVSVVAISWSGYATAALKDIGIAVPAVVRQAPFAVDAASHVIRTGAWFDLPAVAVVLGCTVLALASTRTSATINTIIVIVKIATLVAVAVVGAFYVNPANWHPYIPPNAGTFGAFGWSGTARGAAVLFSAFIGFDGVFTMAEDTRDPQKTMPRSLFASLLIVTVLYVGVSWVVTGLASYRDLDVPDPLYYALSVGNSTSTLMRAVKAMVAVVAIVGLISVIYTSIVGQVRIFYSMGRDRLLPESFSRLRGRQQVPVVGTVVTGLGAAALAAVFPLDLLGELTSIGTLLAFVIVCAGVLILRHISPTAPRPFRTPWVPLIPLAGIVTCTALMFSLPAGTWIRLTVWTVLGLIVYAAYGRHHSKLRDAPMMGPDPIHPDACRALECMTGCSHFANTVISDRELHLLGTGGAGRQT